MNSPINYYAIQSNLTYRLNGFDTLENALKATDFLAITEIRSFSTNIVHENTWKNSEITYRLHYHWQGKIIDYITINEWKLFYKGNYHYKGNYSKEGVELTIVDPSGDLVHKSFSTKMTGIIEGVILLRNYSTEKNLRMVELIEENNALKNEIKSLRNE